MHCACAPPVYDGLPQLTGARLDSSVLMQLLWRRLIVLLVAFAFIAGGVAGAAAPNAIAAEPCTESHGHADHQADHHQHGKTSDHDKDSRQGACISCCCIGVCASLPDVTGALTSEPVTMSRVVYWDTARFGIGRSITPEPGPPRPLA